MCYRHINTIKAPFFKKKTNKWTFRQHMQNHEFPIWYYIYSWYIHIKVPLFNIKKTLWNIVFFTHQSFYKGSGQRRLAVEAGRALWDEQEEMHQ